MLTIQWSFGRSSTVDYYVTTSLVFSATGDFYVCNCECAVLLLGSDPIINSTRKIGVSDEFLCRQGSVTLPTCI